MQPGFGSTDGKYSICLWNGATRQIVIPATVTVDGRDLRAHGEFDLDRDDYQVKATSAKKGTIRVRNNVDFTFDIVAHKECVVVRCPLSVVRCRNG